ncbi:MAG: hypothetical protein H0U75_12010 [Legionella sp.]|nr:hypothetical protein [Legionella sp.]
MINKIVTLLTITLFYIPSIVSACPSGQECTRSGTVPNFTYKCCDTGDNNCNMGDRHIAAGQGRSKTEACSPW